jgi:hypothetical protein
MAVRPVPIIVTAASSDSPSGMACSDSTFATACSAQPPPACPRCTTTRWPSQLGSTTWPNAVTTPVTSRPGIIGSSGKGNGPPCTPSRIAASIRWTPEANTAMRI